MSIDLTGDNAIPDLPNASSSASCPIPAQSSSTQVTYTSTNIKHGLRHDKSHYKILSNPSKRATASCWAKFSLPAVRISDEKEAIFSIIKGFASCNSCFETYFYNDSSTTNLNSHRCPMKHQRGQLTFSGNPLKGTIGAKLLSKKKGDIKKLCANWVACSMRPFSIVTDPGFKQILQECLTIGRDLRSEGELTIDDLLPSDRTVRNEVDRAAQHERNLLKIKLVAAADDYRLSISPDIWSDKYRNISYLGATAHFVGDNGIYHYFDLFCSEFKWKNKTALNVLKMLEAQLSVFGLKELMDKITFVTDRGANFIKALMAFRVLLCVAHRLNNVLKKTFYQEISKKKTIVSPGKILTTSTSVCRTEITPTKTEMTTITTRTFAQASPEGNEEDIDDKNDIDTEESSDDDNDDDDDVVDYTSTTIANLPPPAKAILDMIKDCKSLVKYVKKANLNRELQLEREKQNINNSINGEDPPYTTNNSSKAATLHQSSVVRSPPEAAAAEDQLQYGRKTNCFPRSVSNFSCLLLEWKNVLKEVQVGNSPSLHCVLPCITYLREQMINGEKKERGGMKFFYKRVIQLLDNMFKLEDDHIRASFLHPNYKQLRGATKTQIKSCHAYCRGLVLPDTTGDDPVISDKDVCEPPSKKSKFMLQLMDKNEIVKEPGMNEIDRYNALTVEEEYTNPLTFWQQQHIQLAYPTLYRLAKRTFAVPCSSAAVERQFSAAGQIVTQRRSNLDPSTVNNLIFLRSIENSKRQM
ncbi:unnamed protein product [Rotaria magnacalcarata]|uniref:Transposase n=2 Tax=Rotaria magnacalcarata TaxID=392030 RepID=A0A816LV95_9BILA|nr:unnamed protein product [Rotaria magnacalcarata]